MTSLDLVQIDSHAIVVAGVSPAQAATPTGSFGTIMFWNPNTGGYQGTAPTITVGQEAGVNAECLNTSAYTQNMYMQFEASDPDGLFGILTSTVKAVAPGDKANWSARWTCSKVGNYSVTIYLYGEVVGVPVTPTNPLVTSYLAQIAAATTYDQLTSILNAFYFDYFGGRLSYEEYMVLYDAYYARWYQL